MHDLKTLIGKLNFMGAQQDLGRTTRRLALSTAALFRGPARKARETVEAIAKTEALHDAELASWLEPEDVGAGKAGPFDACDLRIWLLLARRAGVPAVPAREILSLSEDELSAISQKIQIPDFIAKAISRDAQRAFPDASARAEEPEIDVAAVIDRTFDAMDEVPADHIVRSHISGPSTLKALAGSGVLESGADSMVLDHNLEVGPGWVRHGNRRRVDATDSRFVDTFARGHKPRIHYLARPWVEASRHGVAEDPHRHGTPFAGKGRWPMEWRVFVENGQVTGVACYYGWVGEATPENARNALEATRLAQKIVDAAKAQGLASRWMDLELARAQTAGQDVNNPALKDALARFGADGIHCTLDFIETDNGVVLLEGGPAHTPIGGGHPCAFAGHNVDRSKGLGADCRGVALKLMDHVCLGDPKTWDHGVTDSRILTWEEARALAAS